MDDDSQSQKNTSENDYTADDTSPVSSDESESSSRNKIFDITSDLNIMPVSEAETAEEKKDIPIPNFAEKVASETKNARIYRENVDNNKSNPSSQSFSNEKKESINPEEIDPKEVIPNKQETIIPNITVSPEISQKYHTSTIVETKPWVKNKSQEPISLPETEKQKPTEPAKTVINKEIPLQDINPIIEKAKGTPPKNPLFNRIFAGRGVPKNENLDQTKNFERTISDKISVETLSNNNSNTNLRSMRTYEGDVAELLSKKGASTATIAIAESQKNIGESSLKNSTENHNAGKKAVMLLLSLILIGSGVTGAYYLYMKSPLAPAEITVKEQTIQSIIPKDDQILISIDGMGPIELQYKIQSEIEKNQNPNTIREIILTKNINGVKNRVSGPVALEAIDIDMPDVLRRSISDPWMLGIYTDSEGKKDLFVILTNSFFQNAFAGMLQWESVMADDIKQYLLPVSPLGIANISPIDIPKDIIDPLKNLDSILPITETASSTATSSKQATTTENKTATTTKNINTNEKINPSVVLNATTSVSTTTIATTTESYEPIKPAFTIRGNFVDRIVKNRDIRAFRTSEGNILFIYSFIDSKNLVITTKESTLAEILERIEKQAFVR
jgi:hypothetical protein